MSNLTRELGGQSRSNRLYQSESVDSPCDRIGPSANMPAMELLSFITEQLSVLEKQIAALTIRLDPILVGQSLAGAQEQNMKEVTSNGSQLSVKIYEIHKHIRYLDHGIQAITERISL